LGTVVLDPVEAELLLLRLGDTFTIERMIDVYRAYNSMSSWDYVPRMFRNARQPKVIPYLAEDFNSEEDQTALITLHPASGVEDLAVGVPARSVFSGVLVTDIIKGSSQFSPEMKAWASRAFALRLESPVRFLNTMKRWWEANKAVLEAADYGSVKSVSDQNVDASAFEKSMQDPNKPAEISGQMVAPPAPMIASHEPPSELEGKHRYIWILALCFVFLGALMLRAFRVRT